MNKRTQGNETEEIAINFLKKKGYQILGKNYFIMGGEIDIIGKFQEQIVFFEVKSLASEFYIHLEETITRKKKMHLIKSCQVWLLRNKLEMVDWRIDFIGIILDNESRLKKILHFENAIY